MRNGVQDIAFYGFLVGKSGFNPYCYIMRTSLLEFEKDKFKIQEELYLSLETRLETLYQTITTIVNSLLESSITIGDLAYACRSEYGSFTLGKQLESSSYYEILFIQQQCDGITIKMAQAEKPVHEFGRKVLSLQNENFKCNMVMPAPGAGRAL